MPRLFLERFNTALAVFGQQFPRPNWNQQFKDELINDYSFFSSRIEDPKLDYRDTIRFLNNEYVNKEKLSSFLQLEDHRKVLANMIERYDEFILSEELIKAIHRDLMGSDLSWNGDYLEDNTSWLIVADFDKSSWIDYRRRFIAICTDYILLLISGNPGYLSLRGCVFRRLACG